MFKQRLITALWALPLVTVVVWFGEPWFTIVVALVGLMGAWEFYRMAATKARPLTYLGLLWTLLFIISPHLNYYRVVPLLLTSAIVLSLIWLIVVRRQREEAFTGWVWTIAGILYVGWLLSHLVALRGLNVHGPHWVFVVLFTTFASDSAAFLIGRIWGKHHLAPVVSPHKTWEGAIAGVIAALVISPAVAAFFSLPINLAQALVLGLLISVLGQLGDLSKSLLKRNTGLKDSGNIMPGHGGMLDRIDSVLFAGVVVYYFVLLLNAGWLG
jgi:phosphatidate cytidylyltransferase